MDYEKKYKEAFERTRKFKNGEIEHELEIGENVMEYIFPELKEKEDEKTRKDILAFIKRQGQHIDKFKWHKWIAWLEKQGEHQSIINVPSRNVILAIWDLGNEWKELTGGCISTEHGTQLDYIQKHWHESEYYLKEKQNKQTSVDKIEPRFHVDEWITNGYYTWKIVEVKSLDYILQSQDGNIVDDTISHVDKRFNLWTIEDAKDGDVLVTKDGRPFIFKDFSDINHPNNPTAYCGINGLNCFIVTLGNFWWTDEEVYPATQEQCCFLYQKMKESNYTFDLKNKKLIKK